MAAAAREQFCVNNIKMLLFLLLVSGSDHRCRVASRSPLLANGEYLNAQVDDRVSEVLDCVRAREAGAFCMCEAVACVSWKLLYFFTNSFTATFDLVFELILFCTIDKRK